MIGIVINLYLALKTISFLLPIHLPIVLIWNMYLNIFKNL